MTRAIEAELWADSVIDANTLDVRTVDGIVTLTGSAPSLLAKERTEAIAETIVGVRAIVDRIDVTGVVRDSDELAAAVGDALLRDPATESYEVDVSASDGTVTLRGTVDSWTELRLAEAVAKNVRGVREVRNEIEVERELDRPDSEIAAEVEGRLANDVRVDDFAIAVEVEDRVVELEGTIGSLAEKRRAWSDGWVSGVRAVDASGLEVKWWARDDLRRKSMFQNRSDEEIRKAVRDALLYDPRVNSLNPDVHVSNGIATLSGVVSSAAARRAAESDARNVVGVWGVRNHLKVRPAAIPADNVLEKRVSKALGDDPYVERWDVGVTAHDGAVRLSGEVDSSFERERAERCAERVKGVVRVDNEIEYEHDWVWRPDQEIAADVGDQLFWSPFVDSDAVEVSVANGVVTLTGEVDTWGERADAAKNAWEGGAKDVRNELTVANPVYGPLAYPYSDPYMANPYPYMASPHPYPHMHPTQPHERPAFD